MVRDSIPRHGVTAHLPRCSEPATSLPRRSSVLLNDRAPARLIARQRVTAIPRSRSASQSCVASATPPDETATLLDQGPGSRAARATSPTRQEGGETSNPCPVLADEVPGDELNVMSREVAPPRGVGLADARRLPLVKPQPRHHRPGLPTDRRPVRDAPGRRSLPRPHQAPDPATGNPGRSTKTIEAPPHGEGQIRTSHWGQLGSPYSIMAPGAEGSPVNPLPVCVQAGWAPTSISSTPTMSTTPTAVTHVNASWNSNRPASAVTATPVADQMP
ncbi:MAG: hypothetical protein MOP51_2355 [Citricoccus sp.]|nr:hypothetical protein [Citricoccus sp. WCRC_4]